MALHSVPLRVPIRSATSISVMLFSIAHALTRSVSIMLSVLFTDLAKLHRLECRAFLRHFCVYLLVIDWSQLTVFDAIAEMIHDVVEF